MSLHIQPSKQKYDVAIVGSGAGGGMASKILSEAGLSVAVLEAGGFYDPAMEEYRTQLRWPWESPRRGASVVRPFGDFDAAWGGWESLESLILPPVAPILTGFDPGCWVVEQITGDASHCALGQEILRGKVLMVWVITGLLAMKM